MVKTTSLPEGPHRDKDSEGFKQAADMGPLTTHVAYLSGTDAKHSMIKLPLTFETIIKKLLLCMLISGLLLNYDENVYHWDQTDNLIKETMKTIDNISKAKIDERAKLLKSLNRVSETLKVDSALNEEMKKMAESYNTTSRNISGLTELINNAKPPELLTKLEVCKQSIFQDFIKESPTLKTPKSLCNMISLQSKGWSLRCYKHLKKLLHLPPQAVLLFQQLNRLKSMHLLAGEFRETEMMSSPSTIKLTDTVLDIPIPNSGVKIELSRSLRPKPTDTTQTPPKPQATQREGKGIATDKQPESLPKLILASKEVRPDPDALILVPYEINGKNFQLTEEQIQAHMDKKERIKKKTEEAKLLEMTKSQLIKVVHEEAKKARIDPKTIESAKDIVQGLPQMYHIKSYMVGLLTLCLVEENVIQYPRFTKLIIGDLMEKDTRAYKDYEVKYEGVEVSMIQPEPFESTQGTHRTPNPVDVQKRKRKEKQVVKETSSPKKSLKIKIRQQKPISITHLPPSDDQERDYLIEATQLSLALDKIAKVYEEQQNVAAVKKQMLEDDVEKLVDEDEESNGTEFADTILFSDDDFDDSLNPKSHKENLDKNDNDDEKKDDKKDDDDDDNDDDDDHGDHALIRTRGIKEKVNEALKYIVPKLATTATNDLINDHLPRIVANVFKKESESLQNVDKRVPKIFDHESMEVKIKDILSNQFKDVKEYAYYLEQAQNYLENQIVWESRQKDLKRPKPDAFVFYGPQRNPNEPPSYLYNKDLFFLKNENTEEKSKNEKRFMDLEELSKFCDGTLEKVRKEVKMKIFETEFMRKDPLLGSLDIKIMKAYEREIMNHLKHHKQMRRWESFVTERQILQTMKRQE
nr:hypothetical protein [Tanacetum cinerariifolium]